VDKTVNLASVVVLLLRSICELYAVVDLST